MNSIEKKWNELVISLEKDFQNEVTLKGVLYLIGVQELNMGIKNFEKEEKLNILHIAICKILIPYGYYKFDKIDKDGWPHFLELKALKNLSEKDQTLLIKKAVINYLN